MSRSESLETKKDARKRILYLALNFFVNHTSIKPVKTPLIYQHTNDNDTIIILHTFQAFQLIRLPEAFLYWVCWCPWRELVWQTQWPERSCPLGAPLEMDLSCQPAVWSPQSQHPPSHPKAQFTSWASALSCPLPHTWLQPLLLSIPLTPTASALFKPFSPAWSLHSSSGQYFLNALQEQPPSSSKGLSFHQLGCPPNFLISDNSSTILSS